MATNTELVNIKNSLSTFYKNYIIDNKFIVSYLQDITNGSLSDNNNFNKTIQKLLLCNINENSLITISSKTPPLLPKNNFLKILNVIIEIYEKFIDKLNEPNFKYNRLTKINIGINKPAISNISEITINVSSLSLLDITWDTNNTMGYEKNGTNKTEYILAVGGDLSFINHKKIILNHVYYLLNGIDYNIKLEVNALLSFYKLVRLYYRFYNNSEKILYTTNASLTGTTSAVTTLNSLCTDFETLFTDLDTEVNSYITVEEFTDNVEHFTTTNCIENATDNYTVTITNCNPFIVTIPDRIVKITCENFNPSDYKLTLYNISNGGQPFDVPITKCNTTIKGQYITTIETSACCNVSIPGGNGVCPASDSSSSSPTDTTTNIPSTHVSDNTQHGAKGVTCSASLKKKALTDLKNEFIVGGKILKSKNENIEKYRKNINRTVNRYNTNNNKKDFVNIQLNIYYCLLGIVTFLLIGLSLYNVEYKTKQLSVLGIISFIIILIIINVIIQKKYIEEFKEKFTTPDVACANLISTADKINYIQKRLNIFVPQTKICLNNIMSYLPTLDTIDLYKKLTNSIRKEQKTFKGIENLYYHKDLDSNESTQLLKHEILNKSSLISLISFLYLIIALIYLGYIMYPEYIKIFLFIGLLCFIVIVWIYFINLKEYVRTNSYNKYWSKPSDNTISTLSS